MVFIDRETPEIKLLDQSDKSSGTNYLRGRFLGKVLKYLLLQKILYNCMLDCLIIEILLRVSLLVINNKNLKEINANITKSINN